MDTITFKKPSITLDIQVHTVGFSNFPDEMEALITLSDAVFAHLNTIPKGHLAYGLVKDCTFKDVATWLSHIPYIAFFYEAKALVGAVGFAIEQEPFSQHVCIQECFILKLAKNFKGFGRIAYEYLQLKAKEHEARFIITGTAWSTDCSMDNFYQKKTQARQNVYICEKEGE